MNISNLKSHKYQKFAIDADLLDSKLTKTRLEIIFSSENKSKIKSQMDFDTFINSLVKIAEYKYISNRDDILNKFSNKSASALQMMLKKLFYYNPLAIQKHNPPPIEFRQESARTGRCRLGGFLGSSWASNPTTRGPSRASRATVQAPRQPKAPVTRKHSSMAMASSCQMIKPPFGLSTCPTK